MAKADLFGVFDGYKANLSRNGFSSSQDYYFSAAPGMILPVYHRLLNPNETDYLTIAGQTIVQPLLRPAMCDIVQKIDVFFVPLTKIWTPFANLFSDSNDFITSSVSLEDISLPTLNLHSFNGGYISPFSFYDFNYFYPNIPDGANSGFLGTRFDAFRLCMHLGLNPFALLYGLGTSFVLDNDRVNDLSEFDPAFFPYQLAAYQCIYNDWYRDDDREERQIRSYQLDVYTTQNDNDIDPHVVDGAEAILALRYHQRPRDYFTSLRVNPITSMLNSISGANNHASVLFDSYLSETPVYSSSSNPGRTTTSPKQSFTQYVSGNAAITTGSLRSLFAVEKFMRIYGRAKKNYDSQVLAHFGAKVPRDIKHDISYLGSFSGNIGVSPIYSTANTYSPDSDSGSELGERAGRANGQLGGKTIKFTAPCHGVIMAVYYCVPHVSYTQGYTQDKRNFVADLKDFYFPEFDRLGAQPLYAYEASLTHWVHGDGEHTAVGHYFLGWQRRYMQWKTTFDRHSIAFHRPVFDDGVDSMNSWSPWVVSAEPFTSFDVVRSGSDEEVPTDITPAFYDFFVSPSSLDDLFTLSYGYKPVTTAEVLDTVSKPWLLFQRDPFMVSLNINEKYISTMSTTGEPSLDSMF